MKNLMFKKICLLLVAGILLMAVSSCSINGSPVDPQPPIDAEKQDPSENQTELKNTLDNKWIVLDGKVLYLKQKYIEDYVLSNASKIDNAVSVIDGRFVLCDDGTYKDLFETSESVEEYPTVNIINTLNSGCGIYKITREVLDNSYLVYIYANDGTLYTINEMPKELFGQNDEGYEAYIREYGPITHEDRVAVSTYEKADNEQQLYRWVGNDMEQHTVLWNEDGTVSCDYYPEVSQWGRVKDLAVCKDVILGLTEDGKVLSVGTDFSVDNAVKIDIIDNYNIPVALTADGILVFGKTQYFAAVLAQASEFTDIVDFTYYDGSEFVILAQKSDGSLIATTNDVYNPEYISQPE